MKHIDAPTPDRVSVATVIFSACFWLALFQRGKTLTELKTN